MATLVVEGPARSRRGNKVLLPESLNGLGYGYKTMYEIDSPRSSTCMGIFILNFKLKDIE